MEIDFGVIPDESFLRDGRYFCRITEADYEQSKHEDWGFKMKFTCVAGAHAGKAITDRVYISWKGDPAAKLVSRLKIFAREAGLISDGNQKVAIEPAHLIGRELWVTVKEGDPWTGDDGKVRTSYQVDFAGYEAGARPTDFVEPAAPRPAPPAQAQPPAAAPAPPAQPAQPGGAPTPF
jgi:hypothetical protein